MYPRIAVHLHMYYAEMWNDIRPYLENLNEFEFLLVVTVVKEDKKLSEEIKLYHLNTVIIVVDNRGYDVGPFVEFLNRIDLNSYDLIFKIHTKNRKIDEKTLLNNRYLSRTDWFKLLIAGIMGNRKIVRKNVAAFQLDKKMGMIGSKYLIASNEACSKKVLDGVYDILKKLEYSKLKKIKFVAGTMFIVRAELLEIIKKNFCLTDFGPTVASIKDGTLAHIMERCFGCIVILQGYKIKGFDRDKCFEWSSRISSLKHFAFCSKITHANRKLVKICKIPVWYRRFK